MTGSRIGQDRQLDQANGARTHEPSLREVTTELDGLRDLMDERDKRYGQHDADLRETIRQALTAIKEQTAASFAASEKAIVKAENAQTAYNASHNDLLRKMESQMSRPEVDAIVKGIDTRFTQLDAKFEERMSRFDADVRILRESKSAHAGTTEGIKASWLILLGVVALIGGLIGIGAFFIGTRDTTPGTPPPQIIYVPVAPGTVAPSQPPGK